MPDDLKILHAFATQTEAETAMGVLKSAGIESSIQPDADEFELLVRLEDEENALYALQRPE